MGVDCRSTVVDWANFMRDVCQEFINRNPQEIGGFGDNGQNRLLRLASPCFFTENTQR